MRTDEELLAAHVAGDRAAFGELVGRHRDRLWAVALRTMGNPADAEDGLQDGLVAAFRRAGSFRGNSAVTTWLHRVVVNACLDRLRAAKVRQAESLPDDVADRPATPDEDGSGPERAAEESERRRDLLTALSRIPPRQRAALVLVDMEGYRIGEAAEILDCAAGTVKSRCARGRRRLAELLDLTSEARHTRPRNRRRPGPVRSSDTRDDPMQREEGLR